MSRLLLRTGFVLVALVLLLLIANAIWIAVQKAEFEERLAALRAQGFPVEMTDLGRPPIPEKDNAAPFLLEARNAIESVRDPSTHLGEESDWTDEEWNEVSTYLEELEPCVELLRAAAAKPDCRFDTDWEDGILTTAEEIPCVQKAIYFLDLQVRWSCRFTVAPNRCVDDVYTAWRISGHIENSTLIHRLVIATVQGAACDMLERLASHPGVEVAKLRERFEPLLAAAEDPAPWREALRAERCSALWIIFRWLEGDSPMYWLKVADGLTSGIEEPESAREWYDPVLGSWLCRGLAYREGLRLLDFYREAISLVRPGEFDAITPLEELARRTKESSLGLTHFHAPLPEHLQKESVHSLGRLRVARVGLAVAAHRAEHGDWPASLSDLSGPVPVDPYTGRVLRYELTDAGPEIEACRPMKPEVEDWLREELRIVWRLER